MGVYSPHRVVPSLLLLALTLQPAHSAGTAAGHRPPVNVSLSHAIDALQSRLRELKSDEQIRQEEASAAKKARNANCAFNLLQAVNFLARSAFQIHVMTESCPDADHGDTAFSSPLKTCLISTASLITSMSQIAAGLSVAANACQDSLNIDAMCAAPIAALFTPVTQFIAASTAASASCAKEAASLPKDIELDRRLQLIGDEDNPDWVMDPENRRWQIGECVIDATSAVMAMGQLALGFNAATKSCPALRGEVLEEEVSRAACTVDAAFTFFSFTRVVLFVALAVEHCAPGDQHDSLCVAACTSLTASSIAVSFQGAAIYLNCQIGGTGGVDNDLEAERRMFPVAVESQPPRSHASSHTSRNSTRERLLTELSHAAGYERRLSRDELLRALAGESGFKTPEELWLSLGYNFSDPHAAWKQPSAAEEEVLHRGRQMLVELQTEREEPSEELLHRGPEETAPGDVPEILGDPMDDSLALLCSERGTAYNLDLIGHAVSLEESVAACQARCARAPGCAHFSFWPPQRHCRLHGILAQPLHGQPYWISGPPGCQDEHISPATLRTLRRAQMCYHPHAVYEPRDTLAPPVPTASIHDCQHRCQQTEGCVHFIFSELDGLCSLADAQAVKLQPVLYSVAGPRHCSDAALSLSAASGGGNANFDDRFGLLAIGSLTTTFVGSSLLLIAAAALVLGVTFVASRRVCRHLYCTVAKEVATE